MTTLMQHLERLFPAFDEGVPQALEAFVRERFAPDIEWMLWGWENVGLDGLLHEWLNQQRAWSPQRHEILHRVDEGDAAACELVWTGTHSGPLELPTGGTAEASGKEFTRRNLVQAWRGDDGRIVKWHVLSAYPEVIAELSGLGAPETNKALTEVLTPDGPRTAQSDATRQDSAAASKQRISDIWRDVWYPAWDGDDLDHFVEATEQLWYPDSVATRHDDPERRFEELFPLMIEEHKTWRPQKHVMMNVIDDGNEWASWQYHWTARYSGDRKNPDGSELAEEQRRYEHRAGVIVRWDGTRMTYGRGFASFSSHEEEMGLENGDGGH